MNLATSLTNLVNAIVAFLCSCWFIRKGLARRRYRLWYATYLLLALGSLLGFVLHGFPVPERENTILWSILYLLLGLALALYVLSVRYDVLGTNSFRRFFICHLLVSFVVCMLVAFINTVNPDISFPLFSFYAILNALYAICLITGKIRKDRIYIIYLIAMLMFMIGSFIQAVTDFSFTFIIAFNHDAIYHLFVLIFLVVQFIGILKTDNKTEK